MFIHTNREEVTHFEFPTDHMEWDHLIQLLTFTDSIEKQAQQTKAW